MSKNRTEKEITAEDVAGLAAMFGVNFAQEDKDTLQSWMDEDTEHRKGDGGGDGD